jgi:hypothetical protein
LAPLPENHGPLTARFQESSALAAVEQRMQRGRDALFAGAAETLQGRSARIRRVVNLALDLELLETARDRLARVAAWVPRTTDSPRTVPVRVHDVPELVPLDHPSTTTSATAEIATARPRPSSGQSLRRRPLPSWWMVAGHGIARR